MHSISGPGTHYFGSTPLRYVLSSFHCLGRVIIIWTGHSLSVPGAPYLCRVLPIWAGYSLSVSGTPYLGRVLPICAGYSLSGPGTPYLCRVLPIWAGYSLSDSICAGYSLLGQHPSPVRPVLILLPLPQVVEGRHARTALQRRVLRTPTVQVDKVNVVTNEPHL